MISEGVQKLHWTQRIALVRHNLHAARRTGDFSFFKSLQAHALIEGTDHVALLNQTLGDSADGVLATLDNLNAGIAYVHQDAFKAIYDNAKNNMHVGEGTLASRRSLLRVDICQQRDMADHAIDKTTNSAINLIQAQPAHCQDAVANAWITGATIMADAVCVCLNEMNSLEDHLDDFISLEYSWNSIQNSVDAAISALRGIFSLMTTTSQPAAPHRNRNLSVSSASSQDHGSAASIRSRNSSTASAFSMIKRAFSVSAPSGPPPSKSARSSVNSGSLPLPDPNSRGFRASISAACPTKMPNFGDHPHTVLTTIPPTPAVIDMGSPDVMNPFKENPDYFAFDMGSSRKKEPEQGSADEMLHIEDLDPLYSPAVIEMPQPLKSRRLSESFDMSNPDGITV
ncbi:uncharacterized protein EKO05_0000389 [Ascochyta rabiei]|uniref:Uncharacterized protein n=1 Tax=Didymella rabiei TaxID=5454 RepID=A0A163BQA9_DIDRA|nr:uncharacterized protein EKO05_0000389 [Ascochyta rabiei]KZM21912.1 hypothetical protein ST47_g6927 [Ascochyta rabiei]UPX09705.1 hypothetical protein EKO05_0000389 [Ascochyta rabiei]